MIREGLAACLSELSRFLRAGGLPPDVGNFETYRARGLHAVVVRLLCRHVQLTQCVGIRVFLRSVIGRALGSDLPSRECSPSLAALAESLALAAGLLKRAATAAWKTKPPPELSKVADCLDFARSLLQDLPQPSAEASEAETRDDFFQCLETLLAELRSAATRPGSVVIIPGAPAPAWLWLSALSFFLCMFELPASFVFPRARWLVAAKGDCRLQRLGPRSAPGALPVLRGGRVHSGCREHR